MEIAREDRTLTIRGLVELSAANCSRIRDTISDALLPGVATIELDLSETRFVDSGGLGALVALYQALADENGGHRPTVRLLSPPPSVRQVIELTRMHHLFEIITREPTIAEAPPLPAVVNAATPP